METYFDGTNTFYPSVTNAKMVSSGDTYGAVFYFEEATSLSID